VGRKGVAKAVSKLWGYLVDWGDKPTLRVLEEIAMKKGTIRRKGKKDVIGQWQADAHSLVVETEDVELRKAADEILKTPQTIPVHAPEHHDGTSLAVPVVEPPAKLKYLALFALEMEERGFEVQPDEEEDWDDEDEFDDDDDEEDEDGDDEDDDDDNDDD
jgi:hypothetical protein